MKPSQKTRSREEQKTPAARRKHRATTTRTMPTNQRGKIWVWIGVVAVVVLAAGYGYFYETTRSPLSQAGNMAASAYPQFPRSLILDKDVVDSGNYSVSFNGTNMYTAQWTSSDTASTLGQEYENYLQSIGWKGSEVPLGNSSLQQIVMTGATSSAIVNIQPQENGSLIIIHYVPQ